MSGLKTTPTDQDVGAYLAGLADDRRRTETRQVVRMMEDVTDHVPIMWGDSIIGFGRYNYTNTKGRDFSWFLTGVSPRKQALSIYIMPGFESFKQQLQSLGPHKTGRSCLYVRRLEMVDFDVLRDIVAGSVEIMRTRYTA